MKPLLGSWSDNLGKFFTILNKCQLGTFPSNVIQKPKNDNHCLSITTQSGKATIDLLFLWILNQEMIVLISMRHLKQGKKNQ